MPVSERMFSQAVEVGTTESRTFTVDIADWVAEWGAIQSIESCRLYDLTTKTYEDGKLSGAASFVGSVIESKFVNNIEDNHRYMFVVLIVFPNGQKLSGYFPIYGKL